MKIANYITIQPHEQQTMYLSELLTFNVHPSNLAETSSSMLGKELAEYHLRGGNDFVWQVAPIGEAPVPWPFCAGCDCIACAGNLL